MRGDIFHILNRGVEKRKVFMTEEDSDRFAHNLYDFNDTDNTVMSYFNRRKYFSAVRPPKSGGKTKKQLVDVICWALMPNHPHILVQESVDGGASMFSKKIFGGYTGYFNEKNERSGVLFQGRSKIIKVTQDPHFIHLPFYIMTNPIDIIEPSWRENGIQNFNRVIKFLENYRYSSFLDLIGKENFPHTLNKQAFYEMFFTNEKQFRKDFIDWLKGYKANNKDSNFENFE